MSAAAAPAPSPSPDGPHWDLAAVAPPWGGRPAILAHLRAHLRPDGSGLAPGGAILPDEPPARGDAPVWAPGALDGVLRHHAPDAGPADESRADDATRVHDALRALAEHSTDDRAAALYAAATHGRTLAYADALLRRLSQADDVALDRLRAIGRWLAARAADREAVALGIVLLGAAPGRGTAADGGDVDLRLALGRHEAFTQVAAHALWHRAPAPTARRTLLTLTRQVAGWGRIHLVEMLAESASTGAADAADAADDEVRAWLLREGYRNDVLWAYTALPCAEAGGLAAALRLPEPDDALLRGAGDLLGTLLERSPAAAGIGDYADGAEAAEHYLRHLDVRPDISLAHFPHVRAIRAFVAEPAGAAQDAALGWPARRDAIVHHAAAILARPDWETRARAGLDDADHGAFWAAVAVATALGVDPWEHQLARAARGEDMWWWITRSDRRDRIERVVALADARLPLDRLAVARAEGDGGGPDYRLHRALGFVAQGVRPFPGLGGHLVAAALRSPLAATRRVARDTLDAWPRATWPPGGAELIAELGHARDARA